MYPFAIAAICVVFLMFPLRASAQDATDVIDAVAALKRLDRTGVLADVAVTGAVDFALLDDPTKAALVTNVRFRGPVQGNRLARAGALRFDNTVFENEVTFENAQLGGFTCFRCEMLDAARFSGTTFTGPVQWVALRASTARLLKFDSVHFRAPVSFETSVFPQRLDFQFSIFDAPASFARSEGVLALFPRTDFKSDAVFRYTSFRELRFDVPRSASQGPPLFDTVSRFRGKVDLRRSTIETLVLDEAIFENEISMRGMTLGSARFENAMGAGGLLDLRHAKISGALTLEGALLPGLRLDWDAAAPALEAAGTSADVYRAVAESLRRERQALDAMRADYAAERLELMEAGRPLGDRLSRLAAWSLWTWPTRNGTSLDRIIGIAVVLYLGVFLTAVTAHSRLVVTPRHPAQNTGPGADGWQTGPVGFFPHGSYCMLRRSQAAGLAAGFAAALLFFPRSNGVRYARILSEPHVDFTTLCFRLARIAGLGCLGLTVLVLANRAPALRSLLPFG